MRRHAQSDSVEAGARQRADAALRCDREDKRQRPRPKFQCQLLSFGGETRLLPGGGEIGDMRDQRIEAWAPFGGIDLCDCLI